MQLPRAPMKLRSSTCSAPLPRSASARSLSPRPPSTIFFGATAVGAFGAPTYGTVSLTPASAAASTSRSSSIPSSISSTTGNHFLFSFNGTGVSAGRHRQRSATPVRRPSRQTSTSVKNPPFGTFQFGIACATGLLQRRFWRRLRRPADVHGRQRHHRRLPGAEHRRRQPRPGVLRRRRHLDCRHAELRRYRRDRRQPRPAVPEPETYALFLAGLGAMGFVARRRRPA